jgi:hypothetical protein
MNCAAVTNIDPRQQTRPAASQSDNLSSSTTGPSTSSRTKKVADPPAPTKRRQKTPVMAPMQITDPGHSAWGARLIHRLTLHCQGLIYLKPVWKQRTRPAVTEVTTAPSVPTQDLQHPWILCTSLPPQTKHTTSATVHEKHHLPTTTTT